MSLRIAVDLDGTVANLDAELFRLAEQRLGIPPAPAPEPPTESSSDAPDALGASALLPTFGRRTRQRLWKQIESIDNFWETLDEIESGAVARLAEVASTRRWEVIFLTQRPQTAGDSAQVQSQRWLLAHGFPNPTVFVVKRSRGSIAAALGLHVVVDDRPENCVDVATDSQAQPILIGGESAAAYEAAASQLNIVVVRSMHACLDWLTSGGRDREASKRSRPMPAEASMPAASIAGA